MEERTFNTGKINLNYVEGPPGGRPLLLLHGLAGRWQAFDSVIPRLEKQWHIFAPDLRGHGKSGWADSAESYRIADYKSDIELFIKNCIQEPTVIFGHSLGGTIAIMTAASNPELIKALIIGDSIISSEIIKKAPTAKLVALRDLAKTKSLQIIVSALENQLMPAAPGNFVPAYEVFGKNSPFFEFAAKTLAQFDPETMTALIEYSDKSYQDYDTDELLPKIQCPALLLQANPELGGLLMDEDVSRTLRLMPKAQHVRINSVGHFLYMHDREAVMDAILPFLGALSGLACPIKTKPEAG